MITQTLPAYLYQQWQDPNRISQASIDSLNALFTAYNQLSQTNLNAINALNLPIYTNSAISGVLLDWVGTNLYGLPRPSVSSPIVFSNQGVYNTEAYNTDAFNENGVASPSSSYVVTDDYYKRILTWDFYKGDGFQYNTNWLKRRVVRFLNGVNGVAPTIDNTYGISVTYTSLSQITITISAASAAKTFLAAAIQDGILNVPFQYTYTVA